MNLELNLQACSSYYFHPHLPFSLSTTYQKSHTASPFHASSNGPCHGASLSDSILQCPMAQPGVYRTVKQFIVIQHFDDIIPERSKLVPLTASLAAFRFGLRPIRLAVFKQSLTGLATVSYRNHSEHIDVTQHYPHKLLPLQNKTSSFLVAKINFLLPLLLLVLSLPNDTRPSERSLLYLRRVIGQACQSEDNSWTNANTAAGNVAE
ncbi:hypothetical protein CFP56_008299 [Quercus suber]|uniref:Uncharacterized protein n=1 Tax=Quercus suber TaxID=58331 RepID=A0AAW0L377_QUESU